MSKIVILDEKTSNQIAAGEVIERPSSVVKEMVENSIDAEANQITVEIKNGGISYIRISDNGLGMEADDVEIAFERHATSKIRRIEDLDGLSTMGFRGEALASIAAVSHLEVTTKSEHAQTGIRLKMEGGKVISVTQAGCPTGTTFIIRNLFYNTPARYKFLKKDSTEAGYVSDMIARLALAHPKIAFKYIQNGQILLHTPGNGDLLSTIYSIYGKEISKSVLPVSYECEGIKVSGFVGKPEIARGNRSYQSIFLNGRFIKSGIVTKALEQAYKTLLMQNKFPFCVLLLSVPPEMYDVNVHPQKLEVRFSNEGMVYSAIYNGVKNAFLDTSLIREFDEPKKIVKQNATVIEQATVFDKPAIKKQVEQSIPVWTTVKEYEAPITITPKELEKPITPETSDKPKDSPEPPMPISPSTKEVTQAYKESAVTERDKSIQELKDANIVGQAFNTYIILQNGDNLYIIDQHAAHERIRYETLKSRFAKGESFSQTVLEPFIIKLTPKEYDFLMGKINTFQRLGFEIEEFGTNTVIIRSVPDIYDKGFEVEDFHGILDRLVNGSSNESILDDETIFMISCKSAIKANKGLSKYEIKGLVDSLCSLENPYTCVHGRPIIISLGKKELEKKFKRIV